MNNHRDFLSKSIKETTQCHSKRTLISSSERLFSGFECFSYFEKIANDLKNACPLHSRIAISIPEGPWQGIAILATLYAQRVPVVLGNNELSLHEKKLQQISVGALLKLNKQNTIEVSPIEGHKAKRFPLCGLVLFTSGSTGKPNAVNIPLVGLVKNYQWIKNYFSLTYKDKAAITLPISHTLALNTQFIPIFLAGGSSLFINTKEQFGRQYEMIIEQECTFVTSIAEVLRLWEKEKKVRKLPVCSAKNIQLAGGLISSDHLKIAKSLFPDAVIHKGYGMTETIRTSMISSNDVHFSSSTCGYVLEYQNVKVKDPNGNEVGLGEQGEIHVQSETCYLGYDDEEASNTDRHGYFPTGDIGYLLDNKLLFIVGRKDQVFKIKGEKVSGFNLEKTALEIENITAAKCAAILDRQKGMRPVMFLEPQISTENELIKITFDFEKKMRSKLALSKIPRDVVILDQLPRSQNYKIRVYELEKIWKKRESLISLPNPSLLIRFYRI